ncbi:MAG: bifunctional oligoribonuclease/PAP phosphatase NrnA [Candidatus Gastranaerophilales bacterium]|nr:bifunctional oligoribonuclease/PAP phosphatase NrnA [Candidatus Gastranaerophilales bacterium]
MNTLSDIIKKSQNVLIISHIGPDGDTLGSALGLMMMLEQHKHFTQIDTLILGKVPEIYEFLPGVRKLKSAYDKNLLEKYDLAISVDCAAEDRLAEALVFFKKAKFSVNIDHHKTNKSFGNLNIIDPMASSVGEMLVNIAPQIGCTITKEVATCLYVSILTDTGGFRFENTTPTTFLACAKLLETKIKPDEIYKKCYEQKPLNMIRLQALAINNAKFEENDKIVYTIISRKTLDQYGSQDSYTDGISEAMRQAKTTEISMVLKETPNKETKVSLRSKNIDISKIAGFFGGGGHRLAAGCIIEKTPEEALKEILPIAKKQLKYYDEKTTTHS